MRDSAVEGALYDAYRKVDKQGNGYGATALKALSDAIGFGEAGYKGSFRISYATADKFSSHVPPQYVRLFSRGMLIASRYEK